jgi:O-antigen ligase
MILTIYYYYKYSIRNTVFMVLILLASLFLSELFISDRLESLNYNYRHYLDLWNLNYTKFGSSFGWRIVNWRYLYNEFLKSPIFGLGNVSWMIVNPLRNTGGPLGGFNPHSEFFGLLVQFGLLGTTLFIVAAIIAIVNCVKEIKRKDFAPFEAIFITSLLAGFLGKEMMYLQLYFILILIFYEGKRKDLMENPSPV